jgi:hypothetical protein
MTGLAWQNFLRKAMAQKAAAFPVMMNSSKNINTKYAYF